MMALAGRGILDGQMRAVLLILLYLLTTTVAVIAARTEYLNAAAGSYLPRLKTDVGKWRQSAGDETAWRFFRGPKDEAGNPTNRPLTAAEEQQMREEVGLGAAKNRLHAWIETAGLAQCLLIPILGLAILAAFRFPQNRRRLLWLVAPCAVIALASASAWHRGYFSSLGW